MELVQTEHLGISNPVAAAEVKITKNSLWADLIFGSISGFTGKIVEYPFDTIKVHLQTQERQSLADCVKNVVRKEGFRGFFNGISAPLAGSMAENAVLFLFYNQFQKVLRDFHGIKKEAPLSQTDLCLSGGLSGAVVSFVLTPVELIKCRLQTQLYLDGVSGKRGHHSGPASVFWHTLRSRGISGLYQGHTGTMLREVSGGVAWFGVYEMAAQKMIDSSAVAKSKDDLSPWQLMTAGALAGMSYNAALYPADFVKSRMQSGLHGNDSFLKVTKDIYSTQGAKVFFRGFGITVCRSAPSSGVIFLTYEGLRRAFT